MPIHYLPLLAPSSAADPEARPADHPMRAVTREVAFYERWTPERAAEVRALFDGAAALWHTRDRPERLIPTVDAVDRGGPFADGPAVELGSGTGIATRALAPRFPNLIAVDLSMEMLRVAPASVPRVQADGVGLPFADRSIATLILVNMLLFPSEVDRVLRSDGSLVWVNTAGPDTPIYLSAEDLETVLPGEWDLVASQAGRGTWCVARRVEPTPGAS